MSLDETQLQVLATSGTEKQKIYAKKIMPVRKDGHLLLTTLLIANMITNEASLSLPSYRHLLPNFAHIYARAHLRRFPSSQTLSWVVVSRPSSSPRCSLSSSPSSFLKVSARATVWLSAHTWPSQYAALSSSFGRSAGPFRAFCIGVSSLAHHL